jgi:hypothetical protein
LRTGRERLKDSRVKFTELLLEALSDFSESFIGFH